MGRYIRKRDPPSTSKESRKCFVSPSVVPFVVFVVLVVSTFFVVFPSYLVVVVHQLPIVVSVVSFRCQSNLSFLSLSTPVSLFSCRLVFVSSSLGFGCVSHCSGKSLKCPGKSRKCLSKLKIIIKGYYWSYKFRTPLHAGAIVALIQGVHA